MRRHHLARLAVSAGLLSLAPVPAAAAVAAPAPTVTAQAGAAPGLASLDTAAGQGADSPGDTTRTRLRAAALAAGAAAAVPTSLPAWFTGPRLAGIDVSAYDGSVAWSSHRSSGVSFAWIKATEGQTWRSSHFAGQYAGAAAHGVLRGAYHFARPSTSSGASQARFFVRNGGAWRADGRTLPGALDMEMPPTGDECYGMSKAKMRAWIGDFTRQYRRSTGRDAIIYTTNYWWRTCTGNTTAFASTNRLWLARYASTPGTVPGGWARPSVWQYSEDTMDKNVWFGSAGSLKAWARG